MTLNDWIMVAICGIVSLLVLIGCIVDLCYLHRIERRSREVTDALNQQMEKEEQK